MDVAMSISSAIDEIYKQNNSLTRKELFKAGMRVGRDMMGTDSNTLILAFAGSSVSTLLLDYAYDLPYQQIINSNNIGIAIMQGLAGSFGIVLSVPLTVLICTVLFIKMKRFRRYDHFSIFYIKNSLLLLFTYINIGVKIEPLGQNLSGP